MGLLTFRTVIKGTVDTWKQGSDTITSTPVVAALGDNVANGGLIPLVELEKSISAWNNQPVTVRHPQKGGQWISAHEQHALENFVVGWVSDARIEDGALKATLNISHAQVNAIGGAAQDMLAAVLTHKSTDVSIGFFADEEEKTGIANSKQYSHVLSNFEPDHIAILHDEVGACSWADGCGIPRLNHKRIVTMSMKTNTERETLMHFDRLQTHADLSHSDVRSLLSQGLSSLESDFDWISDVFEDFVVYETADDDYNITGRYKRAYTIDESATSVNFGERVAVRRRVVYDEIPDEPAGTTVPTSLTSADTPCAQAAAAQQVNGQQATAANFISELVRSFVSKLRTSRRQEMTLQEKIVAHALNVLSEEQVDGLSDEQAQEYLDQLDELAELSTEEPTEEPVDEPAAPAAVPEDVQALTAFVAEIGGIDALRQVVTNAQQTSADSRAALVEEITGLDESYTEEDLRGLSVNVLEKIAATARRSQMTVNYALNGGTRRKKEAGIEVMAMPSILPSKNGSK